MIISLVIFGIAVGYNALNKDKVHEVDIEDIFSDSDKYNGKNVIIEGFYFQGWEIIVLSEKLEPSGYAEGHLVPEGRMIWVKGGIPKEVYEMLYKQQMMGPEEQFEKIRIQGINEYGGEYGHLGGFNSQIIPHKVDLLQWSP